MNKYMIIMLSVLLISAAGIAEEKFIIENETAYKVLNEVTSGYASENNGFIKYVIAENQVEINTLESKEYDLNFSISRAGFESKKLEKDNAEKEAKIINNTAVLSGIEAERNQTKSLLAQVESKKNRLEGIINSSVLMPIGSYNAGMAIFIVLLLLALTMKSRSMLLKSQIDIKRKGLDKERAKE